MRLFFLTLLILTSCATRYDVPRDYWREVQQGPQYQSKRTVILFLVDGLSFQALNPQLKNNRLPNLQKHFLTSGRTLLTAHSVFPSLTFPNLSSLLHEKPVHLTGALGNKVIRKGQLIDFEEVSDRREFGQLMKGNNIFTRLAEKGQRSVSLDYGLGVDATFHSEVMDLKSGLALAGQDYLYVDQKKIESLKLLLSQENVNRWPEFIFIHLVGVDFLSHIHGPGSKQVSDYLVTLDKSLKAVFKLLQDGERSGHETVSILTADHGFSPKLTKTININKLVKNLDPKLNVINEVRHALVYDVKTPTPLQKEKWAKSLITSGEVEIVSYRQGTQVRILSKSQDFKFDYQKNLQCPESSMGISVQSADPFCPSGLQAPLKDLFYPHLIENLAFFFQAEKHPDLLLIPARNTSFAPVQGGYHGGPTPEETLVPLLMRNGTLADPSSVPALYELLRFM